MNFRSFMSLVFQSGMLRVFGVAFGLFVTIVVSRIVSQDQAGIYFYNVSMVLLATMLFRFGVDNYLIRNSASGTRDGRLLNKNVMGVIVGICIFFCVLVLSLYLFASLLGGVDFSMQIILSTLAIPCIVQSTLVSICLQGEGKVNSATVLQSVAHPICLIVVGAIMYALLDSLEAVDLLLCYFISSGIVAFGAGRFPNASSLQQIFLIYWSRINLFMSVFSTSKYVWVSNCINLFFATSPVIIAGLFLSNEDVAELAVSQRLAGIMALVLVINNNIFASQFARVIHDRSKLSQYVQLSIWFMAIMAIAFYVVFLVFGDEVLTIFGDGYSDAVALLWVLGLGQVVNLVTGPGGLILNLAGYEKKYMNITLFSSVVGLVLTLFGAFYFNALGAVVGVTIGMVVQNIGTFFMVRKLIGFYPGFRWR